MMDLYSFYTVVDGTESRKRTQYTAIGQGCPLSPYLFITLMTVMFSDIKEKTGREETISKGKIEATYFAE